MQVMEVDYSELQSEHDAVFFYKGQLFTGKAVEYNDAGIKVTEDYFLNGFEHGVCRSWFNDGTLESEDVLVHGEPHGVARSWYPNGQLRIESHSEYGIYISEKRWSEQGELLSDWKIDESHFLYPQYMDRKAEASKQP